MGDFDLQQRSWWNYIEQDLRELLLQSALLFNNIDKWEKDLLSQKQKFHDYSFLIFPAAKAYEGFLKKIFFDKGFISEQDYFGKRFRIGKSLNPNLEKEFQNEHYVYGKVVDFCGGNKLADKLWQTWIDCRNLIFHWFPNEAKAINYSQAYEKFILLLDTMDEAYKGCKMK